ncbi:energy transducer TonB [Shewanella kaireitica]|uniref:energy transducer TonB n=1 Tax=Shewanella kaireitica TaxID=212021 RepID=UPI00200DAA1E|nr:energy transducer TonB [Shewanella kaireitica]MCL1092385.1 energy transducer TonB [Shewanella kaireitica]
MKSQILKLMSILPLVVAVNANANHADVKLTHLEPEETDALWVRAKQFTPRYPMKLAMKGIVGCGVFKVIVDESGKTDSVELVSSIPQKVIYKPAKKVIKSWEWKNASGEPSLAEEKIIRLDFCMGGKTEAEAKARCAEQAKLECSA